MARLALSIIAVVGFAACGGGEKPDPCVGAPTYTNDVRPLIIEPKCLSCHSSILVGADRNGAPAGYDFETYELAQPKLDELTNAITSGREPPMNLDPPLIVTPAERDLVRAWRACDYPR